VEGGEQAAARIERQIKNVPRMRAMISLASNPVRRSLAQSRLDIQTLIRYRHAPTPV
jgi:hypothetical protein